MSVINTNLTSLASQHNLGKTKTVLATSMERLSSGLRVNSAKDDAAGQAIGNRMQAQITGLEQAARNANDGISLSQTAQGVLDSINDKLHRIRELTVQGLNEVYNGEVGDKIQAEINLGLKEIDRIVKGSTYSGIPLLDGSAGMIPLQVGADDRQTLDVNLGSPGFSVEEIGLLNMTFQGRPDNITPVDMLSGRSTSVPLDSELTDLTYNPPENTPNLVTGASGSPTGPTLIQYGGENGRLHNHSSAVTHDTDTLENNVRLSTSITEYPYTNSELILSRTFLDNNGDELSLTSPSIVQHDGKFFIQERMGAEKYQYYEAELTIKGDQNAIVAQAITDAPEVKLAPGEVPTGGYNNIRYTPMVPIASSQYSVEIDGADDTSNDALTLVRLNSYYYVEEKLSEDNYAYYKADVTIKTGGQFDVVEVITAREPDKTLVVEDQPFIGGTSTIHLKPENGNITVDYVELSGRRHEDVMRPDGEGGYVFNVDEFIDESDAHKTAKVVTNQNGERLLQTFNGMGEVVLYYPMEQTITTNVDNNSTRVILYEADQAQRLRNPAKPLAAIDRAISQVDEKRSYFGALENRLGSVIATNTLTATNLSAAQSRIMDADYAVEVSNMTRAQILQQAGTSVLAQANQIPQNVLSLLD